MPNLSIKNVPADIVSKLHDRAAANHRSLQGELLALVTAAASEGRHPAAEPHGGPLPKGHKTIERIAAEHLERTAQPVTRSPRAVELIRADRDGR